MVETAREAGAPLTFGTHLSEDRTQSALQLPGMAEPVKMTVPILEDFMRELATLRGLMLPAHEPADPTSESKFATVPAIRWFVCGDDFPQQIRLFLLHPGFGWLWMPLDGAALQKISDVAQPFLEAHPLH